VWRVRTIPTPWSLWKFPCRSNRMHPGDGKAHAFPVNRSTPKDQRVRSFLIETKPIRVLIIDDHAMIRAALRMFLDSQPGVTLVGEGSGPEDALAIAILEHPDIILLDLDLGGSNGLDLLPQ
jgi:PleD family two-component response regulator